MEVHNAILQWRVEVLLLASVCWPIRGKESCLYEKISASLIQINVMDSRCDASQQSYCSCILFKYNNKTQCAADENSCSFIIYQQITLKVILMTHCNVSSSFCISKGDSRDNVCWFKTHSYATIFLIVKSLKVGTCITTFNLKIQR